MKLQVLFKACDKIIQTRLEKNPEAKVKVEGDVLTYRELSEELQNLESWCYKGEFEVQKIVRCKNCQNYKRYKRKSVKNPYEHRVITACSLDKKQRPPEFFCSCGEEREK